ncbi:MAG: IS1595 family transposase [Marinifilaceae bacterium]|jgi:transposase-like protein|nr:IS1595 family transposase [Marinifilaceae bacterium]
MKISKHFNSDLKNCKLCNSDNISRHGIVNGIVRYRCNHCGKTFNVLTNTSLANLRKKEKWSKYCECLRSGISIRKAAEICGIHRNTALRWRHRFLAALKNTEPKSLSGKIEEDECFFHKSEKGNKNLNRLARKRAVADKTSLTESEKIYLFVNKDEKDKVYNIIADCADKIDFIKLSEIFDKNCNYIVRSGISFLEDLKKMTNYNSLFHTVCSNNQKMNKATFHCIKLKSWMLRFNGVATKYLENYTSWFSNLNNLTYLNGEEILISKFLRFD